MSFLADTKGPEIRVGDFENGKVTYKRGSFIKIFKKPVLGNEEGFHIPNELYDDIKIGDCLLIDDRVRLTVIEKEMIIYM